jgi:hypothetical protein
VLRASVISALSVKERPFIVIRTTEAGKVRGFHDADYEECRILGCGTVDIVRTEVSEEHVASIYSLKRIRELGIILAVLSVSSHYGSVC